MADKSYFEKLRDPRWQARRLRVMERAGFACEACGAKDLPLEIHHGLYRFGIEPWDLPDDTLWCLCEGCHNYRQDQLADLKLELGRLNPSLYGQAMVAILEVMATGQYPRPKLP